MPNYYTGLFIVKVYGVDVGVFIASTAGDINSWNIINLTNEQYKVSDYMVRQNQYVQFRAGYSGDVVAIFNNATT